MTDQQEAAARTATAHAEIYAAIDLTAGVARELKSLDPETEGKHIDNADKVADTKLRKLYAKFFIGILIGQLLLMNLVFIGVGVGCLGFEEYALHLYMGGTLAEVFGVVFVITKYLFSKRPT